MGTTTNLQIVLNTPKKSRLKSGHPQKILDKFSLGSSIVGTELSFFAHESRYLAQEYMYINADDVIGWSLSHD